MADNTPPSPLPLQGIQAQALQCLAKLAGADPVLAQVVVSCGILDGVALSMSHESAPVQTAANAVLASVARSTQEYAHRVLAVGVMPGIMAQLSTGPAPVKEAAVKSLNSLILSSEQHATLICDRELLTMLVALLHTPESPVSLCRAVVNTLGNTASFNAELALKVVGADALPPITAMVCSSTSQPAMKAAALTALSQVCKHSSDLASSVVESGVLLASVQALTDRMTPAIRRAAAALLLQVVQKTPDLAEVVAGNGAPGCLTRYLQLEKGQEGALVGVMIAGEGAGTGGAGWGDGAGGRGAGLWSRGRVKGLAPLGPGPGAKDRSGWVGRAQEQERGEDGGVGFGWGLRHAYLYVTECRQHP